VLTSRNKALCLGQSGSVPMDTEQTLQQKRSITLSHTGNKKHYQNNVYETVLFFFTSRSAIAERPRDDSSTSNRKPVKKIAFVRRKSVDMSDFWVTSIAHYRWKGTSPINHCSLLGDRKLEGLPFHVV